MKIGQNDYGSKRTWIKMKIKINLCYANRSFLSETKLDIKLQNISRTFRQSNKEFLWILSLPLIITQMGINHCKYR